MSFTFHKNVSKQNQEATEKHRKGNTHVTHREVKLKCREVLLRKPLYTMQSLQVISLINSLCLAL